MKRYITLALCAAAISGAFAQSVLSPAEESWLTEKEAKEFAHFRTVRPDATVVRFDFLTSNAARTVSSPSGVTHTFVGAPAPNEWKLPVPMWVGTDKATGATLHVSPADAFLYETGHTYEIHALGDGLSIISEHHISEQIKRDPKDNVE